MYKPYIPTGKHCPTAVENWDLKSSTLKVKYTLLLISDVLYMKTVNWEYTPWFALSLGFGSINNATLQFQTSGAVKLPEKSEMRIWQHFSAPGPFKTNPQLLLKKNEWHTVNEIICECLIKLNSRWCNGWKNAYMKTQHTQPLICREESFSDSTCIADIYIHGIWCLRFEVLSTVLK